MNPIIYGTILFFLLSPGILFRFPSNNHYCVVGIHALLFGIIWYAINKYTSKQEGFGMGMGLMDIVKYLALFIFVIIVFYAATEGKINPFALLLLIR